MPISLSDGNAKLVKTSGLTYKVLGFGIPADYNFTDNSGKVCNTCPGACACRGVCYAKQGRYLMPNVMDARHANLMATLDDDFARNMIALLMRRRTYNVVRIHDSGDFYSQEYFGKWCDIARAMEGDIIFYAYTKTLNLDLWSYKPNNLKIIQSLGGMHDNLVDLTRPHSRIFSSDEARIAAGYIDGNVNDIPAIEGETRIGLVYHGNRKLTLPQVKFFS